MRMRINLSMYMYMHRHLCVCLSLSLPLYIHIYILTYYIHIYCICMCLKKALQHGFDPHVDLLATPIILRPFAARIPFGWIVAHQWVPLSHSSLGPKPAYLTWRFGTSPHLGPDGAYAFGTDSAVARPTCFQQVLTSTSGMPSA